MTVLPRSLQLLALAALAAISATCDDPLCPQVFAAKTAPPSAQLSVGQSVNVSVRLTSCGGRTTHTDVITWSADDTTIVSVENNPARVTARQPGSALVVGTGAFYGRIAFIPVSVVP